MYSSVDSITQLDTREQKYTVNLNAFESMLHWLRSTLGFCNQNHLNGADLAVYAVLKPIESGGVRSGGVRSGGGGSARAEEGPAISTIETLALLRSLGRARTAEPLELLWSMSVFMSPCWRRSSRASLTAARGGGAPLSRGGERDAPLIRGLPSAVSSPSSSERPFLSSPSSSLS